VTGSDTFSVKLITQNRIEGRVNQIIGRTPMEKMEKIQLIGSSSLCESNRASPTRGRRPLPFKRDLMGLSLSMHWCCKPTEIETQS
jgi:hypothetical protein